MAQNMLKNAAADKLKDLPGGIGKLFG